MKKSALIGTALLSAATVAAGIGMIALPHAYASWEWRGYRGDLNHDGVVSMVDIVKMQRYLLRLDCWSHPQLCRFCKGRQCRVSARS